MTVWPLLGGLYGAGIITLSVWMRGKAHPLGLLLWPVLLVGSFLAVGLGEVVEWWKP